LQHYKKNNKPTQKKAQKRKLKKREPDISGENEVNKVVV
jgi:hypothetical protein